MLLASGRRVVSGAMPRRSQTTVALGLALALGGLLGSGLTLSACSDRGGSPTPAAALPVEKVGPRVTEILGREDPLQRMTELSALLSTLNATAVPPVIEAFHEAPLDGGEP